MDKQRNGKMRFTVKLLSLAILLCALLITPLYYPFDIQAAPQREFESQYQELKPESKQENPIMKPSREKRREWAQRYNKAPKAKLDEKIKRNLESDEGRYHRARRESPRGC